MKISKLILLGCILFASCNTNFSSVGKLSLIPADASIVYEIDGNAIFAKSGLNRPDDYKFLNFLKLMNGDASTFIEGFLKNSKDAGIGADNILICVSKLPCAAAYFSVRDKAILESWLKKAELPDPNNEGAFSYISVSNGFNIAWNDDVAVIASESYSREQLAELITPKDNGLMVENEDFQKFADKNADIRLWMKYTAVTDALTNLLFFKEDKDLDKKLSFLGMISEDYANISLHSYLDFEDGKITATASLSPAEEVKKLKEKYPINKESFDTEICKDMPEQSYLATNLAINVEEMFRLIQQSIEKLVITGVDPDYKNSMESQLKEMTDFFESPAVKTVIGALGGDFLLSIHGFNNGIITYPLASMSISLNGENAFDDILKLIPASSYTKQDGYYSVSYSKAFMPFYFAYKNSRAFVSNSLEAVKGFVDGTGEKTFADNPVSSQMSNKMLMYLNLDYASYPENIKMLLQNVVMKQNYNRIISIIDIYEGIYYSSDANYTCEFSLQLKNKNVNALKQILTNLDKTLSSAWMN
jgi:hypothetical protein